MCLSYSEKRLQLLSGVITELYISHESSNLPTVSARKLSTCKSRLIFLFCDYWLGSYCSRFADIMLGVDMHARHILPSWIFIIYPGSKP